MQQWQRRNILVRVGREERENEWSKLPAMHTTDFGLVLKQANNHTASLSWYDSRTGFQLAITQNQEWTADCLTKHLSFQTAPHWDSIFVLDKWWNVEHSII